MREILIRSAGPTDVGTLLRLIRELAEFEQLAHEVRATEADLLREGFGPAPRYEAPCWPRRTVARSASRCTSTISQPSKGARACIWRISSSATRRAVAASGAS